jgi:two-component system, chemotaxis family, chemotaxis protein CheY
MSAQTSTLPASLPSLGLVLVSTLFRTLSKYLDYRYEAVDTCEAKSKQILVIDDDPLIGVSIKTALPEYNYLLADSGKDGLSLFEDNKNTDLILLDYQMCEMNGLTTLIKLRKICPNTKVIIITGDDNNKFVSQALDEGADGFLFKPFSLDSLKNVIKDVDEATCKELKKK